MAGRVTNLSRALPSRFTSGWRRVHERSRGLAKRLDEWRERDLHETDRNGLPIPPRRLRRLVAQVDDADLWLLTGALDADLIRRFVGESGASIEEMDAILDFACGCGRVARSWADLVGPKISGCDYDRRLTDWCASNLPFMRVATNTAEPPLPFEPESFDFVYALSLFTHLTEEAQDRWMLDVKRVLRPGGLFLFTVHGPRWAQHLDEAQKVAFDAGQLVVDTPELSGQEACATFHPPDYVRGELVPRAGLELVTENHEDRIGEGFWSIMILQDCYVARKPA